MAIYLINIVDFLELYSLTRHDVITPINIYKA